MTEPKHVDDILEEFMARVAAMNKELEEDPEGDRAFVHTAAKAELMSSALYDLPKLVKAFRYLYSYRCFHADRVNERKRQMVEVDVEAILNGKDPIHNDQPKHAL